MPLYNDLVRPGRRSCYSVQLGVRGAGVHVTPALGAASIEVWECGGAYGMEDAGKVEAREVAGKRSFRRKGMDDPGTDARRQGIETVNVADGVLSPCLAPILPHTGEPRIRGKVDCVPRGDVDSAAVVIALRAGRTPCTSGGGSDELASRPLIRASAQMTSFPVCACCNTTAAEVGVRRRRRVLSNGCCTPCAYPIRAHHDRTIAEC